MPHLVPWTKVPPGASGSVITIAYAAGRLPPPAWKRTGGARFAPSHVYFFAIGRPGGNADTSIVCGTFGCGAGRRFSPHPPSRRTAGARARDRLYVGLTARRTRMVISYKFLAAGA